MDQKEVDELFTLVYNIFHIPCSIFLLILLRPLYKVAHQRLALFIVLSKMCATLCNMISLTIYQSFKTYYSSNLGLFNRVYPFMSQAIYWTIYVHVPFLALNRLTAIFFAFNYDEIWKRRKMFIYYLPLCWTIGCSFGIFQNVKIISMTKQFQLCIFGISALIYITIALKFLKRCVRRNSVHVFNRSTNDNNNNLPSSFVDFQTEKDRAVIFTVCFLSLLPIPLNMALGLLQAQFPPYSIGWIIISIAMIVNITAIQCVEECCLLAFCKDFRLLVKQQFCRFPCCKANNSVGSLQSIGTNNGTGTLSTANRDGRSIRAT